MKKYREDTGELTGGKSKIIRDFCESMGIEFDLRERDIIFYSEEDAQIFREFWGNTSCK